MTSGLLLYLALAVVPPAAESQALVTCAPEAPPPALLQAPATRVAREPEAEKPLPSPFGHVAIGLCEGDERVRRRYLELLQQSLKLPWEKQPEWGDVYEDWLWNNCLGGSLWAWFHEQAKVLEESDPTLARYLGEKKPRVDPNPLGQGLEWRITTTGFDSGAWVGSSPERKAELRAAALKCVKKNRMKGGEELDLLLCLRHLATVDWAEARRIARTNLEGKFSQKPGERLVDYDVERVLVALRRFKTKQAARDYVVSVGLLSALPPDTNEGDFLPIHLLERARRTVEELWQYPADVAIGVTLTRLRFATGSSLEGALFADGQLAPTEDEGVKSVTLSGWIDGQRCSTKGTVGAMQGISTVNLPRRLANHLLELRKSPLRVEVVGLSTLVVLPAAAIEQVKKDNSLHLTVPNQ